MCLNALRIDGFLWTRENAAQTSQLDELSGLEICFQHTNKNERHLILRKVSIIDHVTQLIVFLKCCIHFCYIMVS